MESNDLASSNGEGEALFEKLIEEYVEAREKHVRHADPEIQKYLDHWAQEEMPRLELYAREHGMIFRDEVARVASTFKG